MIFETKQDMGFKEHISQRWNIQSNKKGPKIDPSLIHSSTLCHYAIPSGVAPQHCSGPLHITVNIKVVYNNFLITLSFPHLVISFN